MTRQKGADEIFCRSCGEAIKKEAELCPECGVRVNDGGRSTQSHDSAHYQTTVSDSWWYGVVLGTVGWVGLIALIGSIGQNLQTLAGLILIFVWAILPLSAYFDMQYIRANGDWNPNTVLWVVLLAVWFVNVVAGFVYLYRRHEVLEIP